MEEVELNWPYEVDLDFVITPLCHVGVRCHHRNCRWQSSSMTEARTRRKIGSVLMLGIWERIGELVVDINSETHREQQLKNQTSRHQDNYRCWVTRQAKCQIYRMKNQMEAGTSRQLKNQKFLIPYPCHSSVAECSVLARFQSGLLPVAFILQFSV